MYGLKWLVDQKVLTTIPLDEYYASLRRQHFPEQCASVQAVFARPRPK